PAGRPGPPTSSSAARAVSPPLRARRPASCPVAPHLHCPRGSAIVRRPALTPRLQPFTSTIFAEMTALATRTNAVNLGQGFPDTDGPSSMLDVARDAIARGVNQYPPGPGIPELRTAIAEQRTAYGFELDTDTE